MNTVAVTHRRYVPTSHAHYGGALVDGAYVLATSALERSPSAARVLVEPLLAVSASGTVVVPQQDVG